MPRFNGNKMMYHIHGIRSKVGEMRELVEGLDQMFDSFDRVNRVSQQILAPLQKKRFYYSERDRQNR